MRSHPLNRYLQYQLTGLDFDAMKIVAERQNGKDTDPQTAHILGPAGHDPVDREGQ